MLTEAQTRRTLYGMNKNAVSRNALLQVGNDVALLGLQQTQRTQSLMLSAIETQANYHALEQEKEAREQEFAEILNVVLINHLKKYTSGMRKLTGS